MESKNSRNTWSPFTGEIHGVNIKEKYMESILRSQYTGKIQGVDKQKKNHGVRTQEKYNESKNRKN